MRSFYQRTLAGLVMVSLFAAAAPLPATGAPAEPRPLPKPETAARLEPAYHEVLAEYQRKGYKDAVGERLSLPAASYKAASAQGLSVGSAGGRSGVLLWEGDDSWVEWEVIVPRTGLYVMEMEYYPLPGKRGSIQRDLMVNGRYQSFEARRILFHRSWVSEGEPKLDNQNNHIRPGQREVPGWLTAFVQDSGGMYGEPMRLYLEQGKQTIRMTAAREPVALGEIRIFGYHAPPAYKEAVATCPYPEYRGEPTGRFEMEKAGVRNDPTIRSENTSDPLASPPSGIHFLLNGFGGWRWRKGGQSATWEFEVPQDGQYNLAIRLQMAWGRGLPVHHRVEIDGKVPFAELLEHPTHFDSEWRMEGLGPKGGEPYRFCLAKGRHTLTLTTRMGPTRALIHGLEEAALAMGELQRQIILRTGSNPDPNQEYELEKTIPGLLDHFGAVADHLEGLVATATERLGEKPAEAASIEMVIEQLRDMIAEPDTIARRLDRFASSTNSLSTVALQLQNQPLMVDYFRLGQPGQRWERAKANLWERLVANVKALAGSFFKNYDGIGSVFDDQTARQMPVLEVWVSRPREYVMILKELIDEEFTPRYGVLVNVNVLTGGNAGGAVPAPGGRSAEAGGMHSLVLAAAGGRAPDVALGVDRNIPVEFAIRNAAVDLSRFADFPEVARRFREGALTPVTYNGGVYAIPEDQNFTMLFYRKDILQQLKLKPPSTWQEVYALLPELQRNGMDFYYESGCPGRCGQPAGLHPFLFQQGADFYTPDGSRSALDTDKALAAFTEWTDLFTNFRVPMDADFLTRFRDGRYPIGVATYQMYVRLATAAPELIGLWEMIPMPGRRLPDGTIDRSNGGTAQSAMIFKQSKNQEAAWKLLNWWTDTETQVRFGTELEALLGTEARWNSANVEAIQRLPWEKRDITAILEQWRWFREMPVVLGGYATDRWLQNAWNQVVLGGVTPREAIDRAVKEVNIELRKKQEEFGMVQGGGGR